MARETRIPAAVQIDDRRPVGVTGFVDD